LPGPALALTAGLSDAHGDPLVQLALDAASTTPFLEIDVNLVRLLELALPRAGDEATRARLLARLARELLADASAGQRRRELIDEAVDLARRSGDRSVLADVLDARMNALWQPGGAGERLVAAEEIIELARATGDHRRE